MDSIQEVTNWVTALRIQGPNKSAAKRMERGPVQGEATMPSSRYCSNYPRNLLVPLSFLWPIPLAVGPCSWLFLIGLHKSSILHSRRGRVLPFRLSVGLSSVQSSRSVMSNSLRPHKSQHARPPCPSPTPAVHSDSHPLSQWCHPAISSSVVPFSSWAQSLSASKSFPMSQLFTWGGQSTGVSALASSLSKKSQGWSPSEWTGWISLQSKGLSRVFSNTTVQTHQFFSAQPASQSNSHIHTWLLEKP